MQFQFIHLTIISHRRFYLHRNNSIKKTVLQTVQTVDKVPVFAGTFTMSTVFLV